MVEQLRREAAIKRINVSQAIEDIKVCIVRNYVRPQRKLGCVRVLAQCVVRQLRREDVNGLHYQLVISHFFFFGDIH